MSKESWKLVPCEPTHQMATAAASTIWETATENHQRLGELAVKHGIAAAPPFALTEEMVERAARAIDPNAWFAAEHPDEARPADKARRQQSLSKARTALAAFLAEITSSTSTA